MPTSAENSSAAAAAVARAVTAAVVAPVEKEVTAAAIADAAVVQGQTAAAAAPTDVVVAELDSVAELVPVRPSHGRPAGSCPKTPGSAQSARSAKRGLRQRRRQRARHQPGPATESWEPALSKALGSEMQEESQSQIEDSEMGLERLTAGALKPPLHPGQKMRQPWWRQLMWWPGAEDGAPPGIADSVGIPAVPSIGSSASLASPLSSRVGTASTQQARSRVGTASTARRPSLEPLGAPPGSSQSSSARGERSKAASAPVESMPELLDSARGDSRRRPRTGTGVPKLANTYPPARIRPGTSNVRPNPDSVKLPSTAPAAGRAAGGRDLSQADSRFGGPLTTSVPVRSSSPPEEEFSIDQAEAALAALLEELPQPEKVEACIALPELAGQDRLIVRGKIDEVMRRHKELVSCLSGRYRPQLESLKSQQAIWRMKHEALVRRKREQWKMDWSGDESTSGEEKGFPHRGADGTRGLDADGMHSKGFQPPFGPGRHTAHTPSGALRPALPLAGRHHGLKDTRTHLGRQHDGAMNGHGAVTQESKEGQLEQDANGGRMRSKNRTVSVTSVAEGSPSSTRPGTAVNEERRRSVDRGGQGARTPRSGGKTRIFDNQDAPSGQAGTMDNAFFGWSDSFKASGTDGTDKPKMDLGLGKSFFAKERSSEKAVEKSDFKYAVTVAKKHNLPVDQVKTSLEEFKRLDVSGDGCLQEDEFLEVVRLRANLPPGEEVPKHLHAKFWEKIDSDKSGNIDFEEYLLWSINVAYSEEMLVTDQKEREIRHLARKNGLNLNDVERIKKVFDEFDSDGSGVIDETEFKDVLIKLMKVKNPNDVSAKKMKRFWLEVDTDRSGEVNFEEFLLWYFNFFNNGNGYY